MYVTIIFRLSFGRLVFFSSSLHNRNIGDEYHYLFECQFFAQKRKECLPKYFITRHNTLKFSEPMPTKSKPILKKKL